MKQAKRTTLLMSIVILSLSGAPVSAGKIEKACKKSPRSASKKTCSCIQNVADRYLSGKDQSFAAKFFLDPQMAQDTRQSDSASKEAFWKRYKKFGLAAGEKCS